jgi:DNA-binding transcriptional ArsR family regulator
MTPAPSDAIFQALGDPTRRKLYEMLTEEGEQNVRQLTAQIGVSQPMVSRHLASLRNAGLVSERREGREHHFSVRLEGLASLAGWMTRQGHFWNARLDDLEDLLTRMDN